MSRQINPIVLNCVMVQIGKFNRLGVVRSTASGLYLDGGEHGEILLPNRYVPARRMVRGEPLDVFVYCDSEDRLVATTEVPRAQVGDTAILRVVSIHPRAGAFLDWGLAKDLLLPFREQTGGVNPGDMVTVRIYVDDKTRRIAATMKLGRETEGPSTVHHFRGGEQVEAVIASRTDLGFKAVVDGTHTGLLYYEGAPPSLAIGQRIRAFIRTVRPDGKLDLSLNEAGYKRVAPLAQKILGALEKSGGKLPLDDNSAPEEIRATFNASKKAFKQALGTLYKNRRIRFTKPGIELVQVSEWFLGIDTPPKRRTP